MRNLAVAMTLATAAVVGVRAQDIKTETHIKADDGKPVVYTGCVGAAEGTQSSFILEDAVPVRETRTQSTVDEAGLPRTTTITTTKYVLVPSEKVDLRQTVGRKVEVTAVLIPAGDDRAKIETKSKSEVNGKRSQDVETKEKVPQGPMAKLRVISMKQVAGRCSE